jgi:hypothetical protein
MIFALSVLGLCQVQVYGPQVYEAQMFEAPDGGHETDIRVKWHRRENDEIATSNALKPLRFGRGVRRQVLPRFDAYMRTKSPLRMQNQPLKLVKQMAIARHHLTQVINARHKNNFTFSLTGTASKTCSRRCRHQKMQGAACSRSPMLTFSTLSLRSTRRSSR